jgi:hypothetical protein
MPQNPHPLRRGDRLAEPRSETREGCSLTSKPLGCLSGPG